MIDPRNDPNSFTVAWPMPRELWNAPASDRLAYWRQAGGSLAHLKDGELARGLDKNGKPLVPISKYTRAHRKSATGWADPNAPPLTPAYGLSRTRALLRWKAYLDRAVFYWDFDHHTGASWGVILDYHRKGGKRNRLPRRDVIGISRSAVAQAKREATAWLVGVPTIRVPHEVPKGHQRIFEPRPVAKARAVPVKDYSTGVRAFRDGKFIAIDVRGRHLESAGGVGTR